MNRRTATIFLSTGLVIVLVLVGLLVWVQTIAISSLPTYPGELSLPGLLEHVSVHFNDFGIPTVKAQNLSDLFLAQGFITAQDRLWQMDLSRRAAAGRLAEIFGSVALDNDRLFRTLGLSQLSARILEQLSTDMRARLESYAAGVNHYIETHRGALPPEFRALRYEPEPWRPEDTVLIGKLMNWRLTRTYPTDQMRQALFEKLGDSAAALLPEKSQYDYYLYTTPPEIIPAETPMPAVPVKSESERIDWSRSDPGNAVLALLTGGIVDSGEESLPGSNNWVVSGARSKSAKPILANDPHLWHGIPSVWYIVQLQLPDLRLAGATLPGSPGIAIGHNDDVAWAVTNVEADVQDMYQVEFAGETADTYTVDGEVLAAEKALETIAVRGASTVELEVLTTRFGPIIEKKGKQGLALCWAGLEPISELTTFSRLLTAKHWDDFRAALSEYLGPPQNFLFADRSGNIGYCVAGLFPIRKGWDGTRPAPGNTKNFDWQGWVPAEDLPRVFNPAFGWLATANNRMVDDRYPHVLTRNWAPAYRFNRIRTLLEARRGFTVEDINQIQADTYSYPDAALAKELARTLEQARNRTSDEEWALHELSAWDGRVRRNAVAPTLTFYTRNVLQELILRPKLGDALAGQYSWFQSSVFLLELLQKQETAWLPARSVRTGWDSQESYRERLITTYEELERTALEIATSYLRRTYGSAPLEHWRWGKINAVRFEHPLGKWWPLNRWLNSELIEQEGNSMTVNVNRPAAGVSMRMVVDMADTSRTYIHLTTGQSGHFKSDHYLDQVPMWTSARLIPLSHTDEAAQSSRGILRFVPSLSQKAQSPER